ncbi:hypothetical protein SAMN04244573_00401 [Azotobacter beijerinckii]|uniref:Uncharacterized protein n=1 Tax=Azotobacter beijerinckii TaxID=170623 RepID=A0A1H9AJ46_9GAMM|nr:hypothetical protein [Azotobacter beijerinckii]SEP76740.1 hypothetical protein SAMN04244573_00401 [Azotobacter beijerinckii]
MNAPLERRLDDAQPLFAELWQVLADSLRAAGLDQGLAVSGMPHTRGELREDSYDRSQSLYVEWRTPGGGYLGSVLVHGDGQAFAEFDVLLPHPRKPQWVIEAATAWGYRGALKSELRLLPALDS